MAIILTQINTNSKQLSNIFDILYNYYKNIFNLNSNHIKCKSKTFLLQTNQCFLVLILILLTFSSNTVFCDSNKVFTNEFAVRLHDHKCHHSSAQSLADKHNFQLIGQIGSIDCHYLLRLHHLTKRSTDSSPSHHSLLSQDSDVLWVEQQHIKRRVKRDFLYEEHREAEKPVPDSLDRHFANKTHRKTLYLKPISHSIPLQTLNTTLNTLKTRRKRDFIRLSSNTRFNTNTKRVPFDDPRWPLMWYLNRGQTLDMNVQMVWNKNITGLGAVVTILDDGLEKDHPDLVHNYDALASFDVNNHDEDPMPRYDMIDSNRHGTRCAGEVAASANNNICAVGVAYNAKVGGVRMLDGDVTDAVEARSLSLNPQHIDIYSASWGPDDDGKTVDGPGELATRAFIEGVTKGRNGLGSIFVWASGNGGREHDNCNCDGYTNSIWTLSISSATENGLVPWYSEACSSTLATTYSSGSFGERQIVTTDLHHGCTSSHTGTSASAPLAAGICALALEANRGLTWRDMQHLVVQTARPANLHARDWKTNGVGRNVSHSFGYGLLDANAMVDLAKDWVTVPSQKMCEVRSQPIDKLVPAKSYIEMSLKVSCENVKFLEHIQAKVTLTATRRGDIHVYLTSPSGTRSTLLAQRPMDNSRAGFNSWPFMSVHSWGENPNGEWRLEIHNEGRYYISSGLHSIFGRAFLKEWTLVLFGTSISPDRRHLKPKPGLTSNTPTVPLSTPTPTHDLSNRIIMTQNSGTKAPVSVMKENTIDDEESFKSTGIDLLDSQTKKLYNRNEGWSVVIHGTRDNKGNELTPEGTVGSSGCALSDPMLNRCIDCMPGLFLFNEVCVRYCPEGYFTAEKSSRVEGQTSSGICNRCHYSCKHCFGPNDNSCSECYSDASLHRNGHCFATELVQEVMSLERWYTAVAVVFLCLSFVFLTLVIYMITDKNPHILCCWASTARRDTVYDGLPLSAQHSTVLTTDSIASKRNKYQIGDISEEDL